MPRSARRPASGRTAPLALTAMAAFLLAGCGGFGAARWSDESAVGQSLSGTYLAARYAGQTRDTDAADTLFETALARDPHNQAILDNAFLIDLSRGAIDEAAPLARRIMITRPDDPLARLTLAVSALTDEDYDRARTRLAGAGRGPLARLVKTLIGAWTYAGEGRTEEALSTLKLLESEETLALMRLYHLGLIADLAGDARLAEDSFRQALLLSQGESLRIAQAYGRFLERRGRSGEARRVYGGAMGGGTHPLIAAAHKRSFGTAAPEPLVSTAREGAAEALFGLAGALAGEESLAIDLSVIYLQLAIALRPDFDLAQSFLGDLLTETGRGALAREAYAAIPDHSALYITAQMRLAHAQNRNGETGDALGRLDRLARSFPDDLEIVASRADILQTEERFEEAAAAYGDAIGMLPRPGPEHWPLYYQKGIAYERSGRWMPAERAFKTALDLQPGQPLVLNYLGYSWLEQGHRLDEAMAMIREAAEARPDNGYIVDSLGWGYYLRGDYENAIKHLERAVVLAAGDPVINDHLGDAYWKAGRKLEARFQWRHALDMDPAPEDVPVIEAKLAYGLDAEETLRAAAAHPRHHARSGEGAGTLEAR